MAIVIPYVKQIWTDGAGGGTPVSAARLGVIEEGILDVSKAPAARVTHNAAQAITSGVATVLAFNTERFDQAGGSASTHHDTVTNNSRLTAIYAGIYQITANVEWSADPVNGTLRIRHQGTTYIAYGQVATGVPLVMNVTTLYPLAASEYVEVVVSQSFGSNRNINSTGNYSPEFMMVRVG